MDRNRNKQGSALIVTLLFGTVAVGLSLLLTAFALSDFRQIMALDESNTARYANESVGELMLDQYRSLDYGRDMMVACDANGNRTTKKVVSRDGKLFDIDGALLNYCTYDTAVAGSRTRYAVYYFKDKGSYTIKNAHDIDLTLDGRSGNFVLKNFGLKRISGEAPAESIMLYYRAAFNTGVVIDGSVSSLSEAEITVHAGAQNMELTIAINDISITELIGQDYLINFDIVSKDADNPAFVDSGITYIESITDFGATARRQIIELDRVSDTIVQQATYVIFGGTEVRL